ncbi:hypothetical protein V2K00_19120 [Pseudomonas alliivorans]|nr:hypothetical protein [Pseudomonas alliivorans]
MEISFKKVKFSFSISRDVPAHIPPDKLLFERAHLDGLLRPSYDNKASLIGILLSQISVLVTIVLTVLASDIKARWGIQEQIWITLIISIFSILGAWSLIVFIKILKQPSFESFLTRVMGSSLTIQDRRFVFILTARDKHKNRKLLVQYSENWKCWLLPNFGKQQSGKVSSQDTLLESLSEKLGAKSSDLSLRPLNDDLISSKISYKNGKFTSYYFDFYQAKIISADLECRLLFEAFEIGGIKYRWMTTAEMKADKDTKEKNSDVIDHLDDRIFAQSLVALSVEQEII